MSEILYISVYVLHYEVINGTIAKKKTIDTGTILLLHIRPLNFPCRNDEPRGKIKITLYTHNNNIQQCILCAATSIAVASLSRINNGNVTLSEIVAVEEMFMYILLHLDNVSAAKRQDPQLSVLLLRSGAFRIPYVLINNNNYYYSYFRNTAKRFDYTCICCWKRVCLTRARIRVFSPFSVQT